MGILDNLPPGGLGNPGMDPRDYKGAKIKRYANKKPDGISRVQQRSEDGRFSRLVDAATGKPAPWPLAGIDLERAPKKLNISPRPIARGKADGYVTTVGDRLVSRPAGPKGDPFKKVHNFVHYDEITFHTVSDGDITYKVVRQPDKYLDGKPFDKAGEPRSEVFHDYLCERV